MATLTIRKLDDSLKTSLRVRAARNNRSMEEEAREILRTGLTESQIKSGLGTAIRKHFEPLGGLTLKIPKRQPIRNPPSFD